MLVPDPPSSDAPLLAGLSVAVSALAGFGMTMYWLMQPTVLPNAPFEMASRARLAPIVQRAPQTLLVDIEQSAVTLAAQENERQGLRPIATARTEAEPAPAQALAQAAPKPARPKRAVARPPRHDTERAMAGAPRREAGRAYANNWWGGGGHSFFGGFGSW